MVKATTLIGNAKRRASRGNVVFDGDTAACIGRLLLSLYQKCEIVVFVGFGRFFLEGDFKVTVLDRVDQYLAQPEAQGIERMGFEPAVEQCREPAAEFFALPDIAGNREFTP